jgi:YD repeat-containing protein
MLAGQLTDINDSRRGPLAYRYDPVGRLLSATTRQGVETFAFDPAGNLLDDKATEIRRPLDLTPPRSKLVDNLLREYAGTHYEYDERGNQIQRWHNGQRSDLRWDLFDRLVHFEDAASERQLRLRRTGTPPAQKLPRALQTAS